MEDRTIPPICGMCGGVDDSHQCTLSVVSERQLSEAVSEARHGRQKLFEEMNYLRNRTAEFQQRLVVLENPTETARSAKVEARLHETLVQDLAANALKALIVDNCVSVDQLMALAKL